MPLFNAPKKSAMGDDTKYSRAIKAPQYVPSREKPHISSLTDMQKYTSVHSSQRLTHS